MIATIAFYVFSAILLASAAMVVSARNPVHSVLFLILAFFNAAALFLIAGAEFLAMGRQSLQTRLQKGIEEGSGTL